MQTTTHVNENQNRGPFHKAGLSFGNSGAIVRMSVDHKIMTVLSSWVRTRKGDTDKVFVTSPEALVGPVEELISCVVLQGDAAKKRYDLVVRPHEGAMNTLSYSSSDGYWAVVYMERIGQSAEFSFDIYRLDDQWKLIIPEKKLADWLHPDFAEVADGMPSAWAVMHAGATLFGGQDPTSLPPAPSGIPAELAEAIGEEQKFRAQQKKLRSLSASDLEAFFARLSPDQVSKAEAILAGQRAQV